jgi:transcriptional antiterminator RfaH
MNFMGRHNSNLYNYATEADLWQSTHWFAIHTKPCKEDVAMFNLRRAQLEVFLPMRKLDVRNGQSPATRPLFPGYLFARFRPASHLHLIQFARGVRRVVSLGGIPIPLEEEIIESIKTRMGGQGCVELEPSHVKMGDRIVIEDGPLRGMRGVFEKEQNDKARVILLLQRIEYQARVLIEKRYLGLDSGLLGESAGLVYQ